MYSVAVAMPPRRRAGSRPGSLSPRLQTAIAIEATGLASLADAADQVRAVSDFYAQLDFELEQVAAVRLDAVRRLRGAGWSYVRIAEATGLSKERVAQLSRTAGVAGRQAARGR